MKNENSKVEKFFGTINKISDYMAFLLIVAILAAVTIQIVGRLADSPAPWTEEATRIFFIGMVYLGVGMGFRKGESARVTVFLDWFPRSVRNLGRWFYVIPSVGFFCFMFYTGLELVVQQYTMNEMGAAWMIPMWLVGLFMPLSAILGILGVAENMILHPHLLEGGE